MTYRIALIGLLMGGCYSGYGQQQQTLPEPVQVAGPPGGQMDQPYGQYPDPQGDPQGYQQGDPSMGFQGDPNIQQDPNDPNAQPADPQQEAAPMADVQDTEIDTTLQGYGSWEQDDDYGRVWRPDVTIVGADFTPYDSDGSWAYTEYGWTFNCDYPWGWLPFHYGRWGWIGNGWGWVPGYQWGPGWVDWRHGGGLVGWRPTLPERGGHGHGGDPLVRDHRHGAQALDSHWHFQNEGDLGRGHIRGRELNNPAEGLRVTAPVQHPPLRGTNPVRAASIMGTRHVTGINTMSPGTRTNPQAFRQPTYRQPQQGYRQPAYRQPTYQQPAYRQPAYRQPTYQQPAYRQPAYRQPTYQQPAYRQPTYRQPTYTQRPTYTQPRPTYTQRPTYQQPPRSTFQPARPSYSAPSHFSPSSSAPSHSSPAPSHSSSAPSHSSSSSSSSHSSGGGGHHR